MNDEQLTFSHSHGYEELPKQLKLEDLPLDARRRIWNVFYVFLERSKRDDTMIGGRASLGAPWKGVFRNAHASLHNLPLEEWSPNFGDFCRDLRTRIETEPFHKVFDLIQFVLRHPSCRPLFIAAMKRTFADCRVAYTIVVKGTPTIIPVATREEGEALVDALQTLPQSGQNSGAAHLRKSVECMNRQDWAGSVRESIHAVESVARQLDPDASTKLGPALTALERRKRLHPALKSAFSKLYGYTSNEEGIRHPLLGRSDAPVRQNEAVFMLSACAAFSSYLCRAVEDS